MCRSEFSLRCECIRALAIIYSDVLRSGRMSLEGKIKAELGFRLPTHAVVFSSHKLLPRRHVLRSTTAEIRRLGQVSSSSF